RDLFSRVLVGSQQSILAGLVVVAIAGMIGSLLGCLSGVLGGRADAIIMRIMDIMLSIPSLVLTMALAAALGPSLFNAMLAIAIVRIPFYVRLARGQALVVRQYTYVQAAKTFGASRWHLINWHILRNSLPPLIVQASLDIGSAILMAATLGFIGLGAQQPSAEWGAMVVEERENIAPGFSQKMTANLQPGEYDMTCGLLINPKGKLIVKGEATADAAQSEQQRLAQLADEAKRMRERIQALE
ncbi:ABC transporter permease subunit, partial [Escherichia sp. R-CC3]